MTFSRPELNGTLGAVSSTHWLASGAGMLMLENGGNAFDAAVASAFVLQVTEPHYNGLGGDVSIVAHSARDQRQIAVCGQGGMPAAATIDHFHDLGLSQIPGSGLLPSCVPGTFDAWMRVLLEHGTKSLAEVLSPALGYATDGFPILPGLADAIEVLSPLFEDEWSSSGATYMPDGRPPGRGSRFRNLALAGTYRRLLGEAGTGTREQQIERARLAF